MKVPETKHETDRIRVLEAEGYTHSFVMESGQLKICGTENSYTDEQVTIVSQARYEGMSNPSDASILYAIETNDGQKGTILVPYGPTADTDMVEFLKNVEKNTDSE